MQNTMDDLRNHLFATLEALQDTEAPMEIARAKAISDVAQTLIDSAKVEVQFLDATGAISGSPFFTVKTDGQRPFSQSKLSTVNTTAKPQAELTR